MLPTPHPHAPGVNRRELLQVGYSALLGAGLASLPALARAADGAAPRQTRTPKSVILVFLTGASSHIDTFDPKPDAPPEIRGEFGTVATKVPGLHFAEHVPMLAARADRLAVVRSLAHRENNHLVATHHMLTGHQQPGAFFDKVASRDDWPSYSATLNSVRPSPDGTPAGVNLPTFLVEGPLTWPGQHAGFLGPKHDPWQLTRDPNARDFRVDNMSAAPGLDVDRIDDRQALLGQLNREQERLVSLAEGRRLNDQQDRAFALLTSGAMSKAFEIDREPDRVRDRYGRHAFGQSLLLARRLVQAGVRVVQANMGRVQNWDTHGDNFRRLKNDLLPPLDRGVSALLDDLTATGLIDETMVIVVGEFGRTPKVVKGAGRDHWAACFTGVFAGGGVRGGQVIGRSDAAGAFPATTPFTPDDVGATVYDLLGIDPETEVRDRLGRPVQLNRGKPMRPLFTGEAAG